MSQRELRDLDVNLANLPFGQDAQNSPRALRANRRGSQPVSPVQRRQTRRSHRIRRRLGIAGQSSNENERRPLLDWVSASGEESDDDTVIQEPQHPREGEQAVGGSPAQASQMEEFFSRTVISSGSGRSHSSAEPQVESDAAQQLPDTTAPDSQVESSRAAQRRNSTAAPDSQVESSRAAQRRNSTAAPDSQVESSRAAQRRNSTAAPDPQVESSRQRRNSTAAPDPQIESSRAAQRRNSTAAPDPQVESSRAAQRRNNTAAPDAQIESSQDAQSRPHGTALGAHTRVTPNRNATVVTAENASGSHSRNPHIQEPRANPQPRDAASEERERLLNNLRSETWSIVRPEASEERSIQLFRSLGLVTSVCRLDLITLNKTTCTICMDAFGDEGEYPVRIRACGHIFGRQCLERWIVDHFAPEFFNPIEEVTCPNCRGQFTTFRDEIAEFRNIDGNRLQDQGGGPERINNPVQGVRPERINNPVQGVRPERINNPVQGVRPGRIENPGRGVRPERVENPRRRGSSSNVTMLDVESEGDPNDILRRIEEDFNDGWDVNRRSRSVFPYVVSEDRASPGRYIYKEIAAIFPSGRGQELLLRYRSEDDNFFRYDLEFPTGLPPRYFPNHITLTLPGNEQDLQGISYSDLRLEGVASVKQRIRTTTDIRDGSRSQELPGRAPVTRVGYRLPGSIDLVWFFRSVIIQRYGNAPVLDEDLSEFRSAIGQYQPLLPPPRQERIHYTERIYEPVRRQPRREPSIIGPNRAPPNRAPPNRAPPNRAPPNRAPIIAPIIAPNRAPNRAPEREPNVAPAHPRVPFRREDLVERNALAAEAVEMAVLSPAEARILRRIREAQEHGAVDEPREEERRASRQLNEEINENVRRLMQHDMELRRRRPRQVVDSEESEL